MSEMNRTDEGTFTEKEVFALSIKTINVKLYLQYAKFIQILWWLLCVAGLSD